MIRQLFSRPAHQPLTKAPRRNTKPWRASSSTRTLGLEQVESRLLLSVNPGDFELSHLLSGVEINEGVILEDQLYFSGTVDGYDVGVELWKYDPAGNAGLGSLTLVADIDEGPGSSDPWDLTIFNGKLYFSADNGIHGTELWEFDPAGNGGEGAARLVQDLWDGGSSDPYNLTVLGDKLYFAAYDTTWSDLLWEFDPAANEGNGDLTLVMDLTDIYDSLSIDYLTSMDGQLYFVANSWDGESASRALWQFDPTANEGAGAAALIADFGEFYTEYLTPIDGRLYFSLYDNNYVEEIDPLWVYDPTANGGAGELSSYSSAEFYYVDYLVDFQNEIYFVGYSDTFETDVIGRFDPTANDGDGEFYLEIDINDYLDGQLVDYLYGMTVVGDSLYFGSWLYEEVYNEVLDEVEYHFSNVLWHYHPGDGQQPSSLTPILEHEHSLRIVADSPDVVYISSYDWDSGEGNLWSYELSVPGLDLSTGVTLSADINTQGLSLEFFEGVSLNGKFYFSGWPDRPYVGNELWVFDPLANDGVGVASLVADLAPGSGSSWPSDLTVVDGLLYFTTDDGNLWRFDPEAADGAGELSIVPDEGEGSLGFGLWELTELGGIRYFVRYDTEFGVELWQYDPTANGGAGETTIVIDIWAGDGSSYPEDLTVLDGSLYFTAYDDSWVRHLWRYDPLANGGDGLATRIDDPGFAYVTEIAALDGRLYFAAGDDQWDQELWYYDPAGNGGLGATAVAAVISELDFPSPQWLTPMAGSLYFSAYHPDHYISLWRFDPTANEGAGAAYVIEGTDFLHPQDLNPLDDILYLRGYNEWGDFYLYKYDPAADEGAGLFSLLTAPNHEFGFFEPLYITASDGRLYFTPEWYVDGAKMWVYDPAANEGAGSANLVVIEGPDNESSNPYSLLAFNDQLYFFANDGIHGYELWRYDPVTAEPSLLFDILPGPLSSHPDDLVVMNDILYFTAYDEWDIKQLWAFDPAANDGDGELTQTSVSTELYHVFGVTAFNGMLYFRGSNNELGSEFWRYDPSTNTTSLLADIRVGPQSSIPSGFTELDGKLYFQANDNVHGFELWVYDPAGNDGAGLVSMAADIREGAPSGGAVELTPLDGKLYFRANDGVSGFELWQYDPATGEATLAADIAEGSGSSNARSLHVANGVLYFAASDAGNLAFKQLWQYDPATGEATLVFELPSGGNISDILFHDGKLYFSADDGLHGNELWQYDTVADLVSLVVNLDPNGSSNPQDLTILDGKLYFTAFDPVIGRELFVFDPNFMQADGNFTTEFHFVETAGTVGMVAGDSPGTHAIFHEWEDVVGELWLTIDTEVPSFPFDFTFQLSSTDSHLADPQLVSHLGTGSQWQTDVVGEARVTTGTLHGLNLSGYEVGDRVLIATLLYPQDLDNLVGISADLPGDYAQPIAAPGVEFLSASIDGELDVAVTPEIGGRFVPVIYDTDDNGRIGLSDFLQFIGQYGREPSPEFPEAYRFDFDRNGRVGLSDFLLFITNYGASKGSPAKINMPFMVGLSVPIEGEPTGLEGEPIPYTPTLLEGEPDPISPLPETPTTALLEWSVETTTLNTQETSPSTTPPAFDPRLLDAIWQDESLEEADSEEEDEWLMALIE